MLSLHKAVGDDASDQEAHGTCARRHATNDNRVKKLTVTVCGVVCDSICLLIATCTNSGVSAAKRECLTPASNTWMTVVVWVLASVLVMFPSTSGHMAFSMPDRNSGWEKSTGSSMVVTLTPVVCILKL